MKEDWNNKDIETLRKKSNINSGNEKLKKSNKKLS
jgi:hypothetical protein